MKNNNAQLIQIKMTPDEIPAQLTCYYIKSRITNGYSVTITLNTGSMSPLLPTGSELLVYDIEPGSLWKGAVVVFKRNGLAFTHRLVGLVRDRHGRITHIRTKGDATTHSDVPVPIEDLLGVVLKSKGPMGTLDHRKMAVKILDMAMAVATSLPVMYRAALLLKAPSRLALKLLVSLIGSGNPGAGL